MTKAMGSSGFYRWGVGIAALTSFLIVWTTIVRDDGNGIGFFLTIMAAVVGAFASWFRADGLARTMVGVAVMQVLLGIAIATAPSIAAIPGASRMFLLGCGVFATLWLAAAACFRRAARAMPQA
ncbi:hypothetical protein M9980_06525 [Sphingomonas donggukensis]|uniref:SPW repeat-containing protein n=1 Tax=Sphingomonas donggukensis TaxID=2949093 RepID=A0ABY4TWP9_9SPHN|nr:hypothetical protein [Sphingomonas donggukensis]URW76844.1 hypothetical protein M9980_06525 [Sphingomonas donggukensis]